MNASRTTVCLCMIVKDEAHVIRRCLASVRPLLDHWIIVDTGSTDGTQDIVREAMAGLPGEVVERPWLDFAHNRSEALALARPHGDYSLVIDADDELALAPGYELPTLDADSYTIDIHYGATTYRRPQLVRNALAWRYRGVLHEFLECPGSKTQDHLPIVMKINHEGRRSTDPTTYAKDAAVLATALATETDPFLVARYTFYLAQSYRDCGEREEALDNYLRRATLGFWIEEVYVSLLQAGRLMEGLGRAPDEIVATYQRASDAFPSRAEAAHAASRFCRSLLRYQQGYELAKSAVDLHEPAGGLFVEGWIYDYGLCDELAVNAYWAGRYRECLDGCLRALQGGKVPAFELPRFYANMRFALDKLPEVGSVPDNQVSTAPNGLQSNVPLQINLGSGPDFRADHLNVDVDASWCPDAVLDLSKVELDDAGIRIGTSRFGEIVLRPGAFDRIAANDVLQHVSDIIGLMTACLSLLKFGGRMHVSVPYDLSFGAWQDPRHVRTFNERSWLYFTDRFWSVGWHEARFVVEAMEYVLSPAGTVLRDSGVAMDDIARTPRAVDAMSITLRKVELSQTDRIAFSHRRDRRCEVTVSSPQPADKQPPIAFAGTWAEHRERHCIWIVVPRDYEHHHAFDDLAETLSDAFAALGGSAPIVPIDGDSAGRIPIVLGAHLLALAGIALPADAVIFNLEQIGATHSPWMSQGYMALLERHPLLDYSLANIRAFEAAGLRHAVHLPVRAMPKRVSIEATPDRDIDVLFYGSLNQRRAAVLEALRARGLVVHEQFGIYGAVRDATIARSKVVLNLHYYDTAIFEAVRVAHLLANGACVVSEGRADDPDCADLADGLVLCDYHALVPQCVELVRDAPRRLALAERARTVIARRTQADILEAVFHRGAADP